MQVFKNLTVIAAYVARPTNKSLGPTHDFIIGDGATNGLPWAKPIPEDLKWFKRWTAGGWLILGRKTWESLPGVLPGRRFVVVSGSNNVRPIRGSEVRNNFIYSSKDGACIGHVVSDPLKALSGAVLPSVSSTEFFVAGGGQIYQRMLPHAHTMILTQVSDQSYLKEVAQPILFPQVDLASVWKRESVWFPTEDCKVQMGVWRRRTSLVG